MRAAGGMHRGVEVGVVLQMATTYTEKWLFPTLVAWSLHSKLLILLLQHGDVTLVLVACY